MTSGPPTIPVADGRLRSASVTLPDGGPTLALRTGSAAGRPFLLVHGLASNARLWDGVAVRLLAAGHQVVAVDLRGHGESEQVASGYDTDTCADDLAALIRVLDFGPDRAPVLAGQSWGGNVALGLAARHPGSVSGVCCVDGGWLRPAERFASFEECWAVLAPPRFEGLTFAQVEEFIRSAHPDWPEEGLAATLANLVALPDGGVRARLTREHHRSILESLYRGDPRAWYPLIEVPVLFCAAISATRPDGPGPGGGTGPADGSADERTEEVREAIRAALALLPDGQVSWYPGADHDIHAQHPDRIAADLLDLLARAEAARLTKGEAR